MKPITDIERRILELIQQGMTQPRIAEVVFGSRARLNLVENAMYRMRQREPISKKLICEYCQRESISRGSHRSHRNRCRRKNFGKVIPVARPSRVPAVLVPNNRGFFDSAKLLDLLTSRRCA